MKKSSLLAFVAVTALATAQHGASDTIKLVFTDTDAGQILMAISMQAGQNIIYANKVKDPISINLTVNSLEDAVKAISAAAGLTYRKVGRLYVVAPTAGIKDALAPYTRTSTFPVDPTAADVMTTRLQDSFPQATVHSLGDRISVTGIPDDLERVAEFIQDFVRSQRAQNNVVEIVIMHSIAAEDAAPLIKALYPGLQVTPMSASKSTAPRTDQTTGPVVPESFGAIGLSGPEVLERAAKATLAKLDEAPSAEGDNRMVRKIYNLKYANGPSLQAFLRRAEPEIEVFIGPEIMNPPRVEFQSIATQITGAGSGSGGSTGSGTSGSTASGGSGSTGGTGSTGGSPSAGGTAGATSGSSTAGSRAKAVVLKGRQGDVEEALKLIGDLDVKPAQVMVEVNVLETSPSLSEQIGMAYTFSQLQFFDTKAGQPLTTTSGVTTLTNPLTQSVGLGQITRTPLSFSAQLSALMSNTSSKVLARPTLQIADNDEGSVFIGNTTRVELSATGALGGVTSQIAEFPVGIILLISPRISPDGNVTMHVNPVISTISSLDANGIPQTSSREADTTIVVKDGDTIILGGLIQDQDTKTISEVPYLSKLPIIGELFKNRTHTRNRTDIIVSITPHILRDKPEGTK